VASDARERGASASAVRALIRAAQLTPDPQERARRLLRAAADSTLTGQPNRALRLLDEASSLVTGASMATDLVSVRAEVLLRSGRWEEGVRLLVAECERVAEADPARAAGLLLLACAAHMASGRMNRLYATARQAADLAAGSDPVRATVAQIVMAQALLATGRSEEGDAILDRHEDLLIRAADSVIPPAIGQVVGMAAHSSMWIERWGRSERILSGLIAGARNRALVASLPYPLAVRAQLAFRRGYWDSAYAEAGEAVQLADEAYAEAGEAVQLADETGQLGVLPFTLGVLAEIEAATGRDGACRDHAARALEIAEPAGALAVCLYARNAVGLLELGIGRVDEAISTLRRCRDIALELEQGQLAVVQWAPNLLEAYVRAGLHDEAAALLAEITPRKHDAGGRWARGCVARGRGLLASDEQICRATFAEAARYHADAAMPFEAARTSLALGERLRRLKSGGAARPPLREAQRTFDRLGAEPWARRARRELRATGMSSPRRQRAASGELTAHELHIALLAVEGMTNRQIAAALFLSPKTIEFHLGQVYRKLGVRSRTQLARMLTATGRSSAP
jgi:DNA-binding NarL/FixJ family response regulator